MTELRIQCRHLMKEYGTQLAIEDVSLSVPAGAFFALLGPSGSGKTTLLRLLAGFERPDSGEILIDGKTVVGDHIFLPPEQRQVGMVFQDFALFPHMTVAENIGFGLGRIGRRDRIEELLALTGLTACRERRPHELSGGQQQRVAIARALAPRPAVILLDEPFSNLDAALRVSMRAEVKQILTAAGATTIFVTHDQPEALSLADEVAVLMAGKIQQSAPPQTLYRQPATAAVAAFVGEANLISGTVQSGFFHTALGPFPCPAGLVSTQALLRPEDLRLDAEGDITATATQLEFFGHDVILHVRLEEGSSLQVRLLSGAGHPQPGERVQLSVVPGLTPHYFVTER